MLNLFYQQDEWQAIGNNIILNNFSETFPNFNLLSFISVQERFASNALAYFLMGKFAFNTTLMGVYSLLLHIINSILVYVIIKKWVIQKGLFAFFGALFFAVSDVSISAVSWFGTSLGTLPAATLVLTSLILFLVYIEGKKKKWLFLSLLVLYLSFYFKEIGIFLLLFLPLASLLFLKFTKKSFINTFWPFFVVFILTTFLRLVNLIFLSDRSGELFVTSARGNFLTDIATRAVMYPLTSFSLTFLPPEPMVNFAKFFTNVYYPFIPSEHFNLIAQTVVIDVFAVFLTLVILFVIYLSIKNSPTQIKKMILFWTLFFVLSFLPYVLLSKSFSYLESRYYYLSNLPAGILLGFVGLSLRQFLTKWHLGTLSVILVSLLILIHVKFLTADLKNLTQLSQERVDFIGQLKILKPTLDGEKNIFYLSGNHDYYVPGNKVPFQQGMGYTFMVLYYPTRKIPKELIADRFLWNLNTQGYREINGFGFGFFTSEDELTKALKESGLSKDMVVSLYYDSDGRFLIKN